MMRDNGASITFLCDDRAALGQIPMYGVLWELIHYAIARTCEKRVNIQMVSQRWDSHRVHIPPEGSHVPP